VFTQSMPCLGIVQAMLALLTLAQPQRPRYSSPVAVNPAAGFGDPLENLAHMRPKTIAGAFFVSAMPLYGGRAWETFGSAGFQVSRFANLRTAATHNRLATVRGSSRNKLGAPPMKHPHALNPSAIQQHAAALKARAFAALRADSSLSVRLARYNVAMAKARELEAQAEYQATSDASEALARLQDGHRVCIRAACLREHLEHVRALALEAQEVRHA
jgi:hypothetical protein